jgi:hypothetical protein
MAELNAYPDHYRESEIGTLIAASRAGECAAVLGLSGAGKSNVLRRLTEVQTLPPTVLVDCNRLSAPTPAALFDLMRRALGDDGDTPNPLAALEAVIERRLRAPQSSLALALDRFDALASVPDTSVFGNLRALRDTHKYRLTFVIAARRPLDARNELAELFFANTLWLGPLSESDARWTIARFSARGELTWDEKTVRVLIDLTRAYPSFLRAACEAHAGGAALSTEALAAHPALQARLAEFWSDQPTDEELRRCGLEGLPLLRASRPATLGAAGGPALPNFDTSKLTAKENLLLQYFLAHPNVVCEKDALIRAVWPEDKVFTQGVRDDSLAQVVRRLREKVEPDPAKPRYIHTVTGRGYRFTVSHET